jgi:hypothetical protein
MSLRGLFSKTHLLSSVMTGEREREREREFLFERETEHLWLRQLMHGIGEGPR